MAMSSCGGRRLRNEVILGGIDRDLVDPSIELAVAAKGADRAVSANERLLGHVLAFAPVGDIARNHADELVLILAYQQIESALVSVLDPFDQGLIGICLAHPGHAPFVSDPIKRQSKTLSHRNKFHKALAVSNTDAGAELGNQSAATPDRRAIDPGCAEPGL
jgi:hypothetical protein